MTSEKSNERTRVLIISDSLGLPRKNIPYEETYPHLLKTKTSGLEVIMLCEGGTTTRKLPPSQGQVRSPSIYKPDVIVTHLGIVDCAPRYSNMLERKFLFNLLPSSITEPYMEIMKKFREPQPRRQYVNISEFENNIRSFYEWADGREVFSIRIKPATPILRNKSPKSPETIERYNDVYRSVINEFRYVHYIDPYEKHETKEEKIGTGDGIHIPPLINNEIFREIYDKLDL